jgi:hypothetical protein
MLSLARCVAILDEHTRLACLETDASLLAALGTAVDRHNRIVPHDFSAEVEFWRFGSLRHEKNRKPQPQQ